MTQQRTIAVSTLGCRLNQVESQEILALFDGLHDEGQTILLVTHEHDIAAHARRQVHLKDGRVERDFATEARR